MGKGPSQNQCDAVFGQWQGLLRERGVILFYVPWRCENASLELLAATWPAWRGTHWAWRKPMGIQEHNKCSWKNWDNFQNKALMLACWHRFTNLALRFHSLCLHCHYWELTFLFHALWLLLTHGFYSLLSQAKVCLGFCATLLSGPVMCFSYSI